MPSSTCPIDKNVSKPAAMGEFCHFVVLIHLYLSGYEREINEILCKFKNFISFEY